MDGQEIMDSLNNCFVLARHPEAVSDNDFGGAWVAFGGELGGWRKAGRVRWWDRRAVSAGRVEEGAAPGVAVNGD